MEIDQSTLEVLALESFLSELNSINKSSFKPPSKMSILEWAENRYVMSSEYANEAGKYSTKRAWYQKGILEAIGDNTIREVVLMTSSQIGKSIIQLITLGYFVEQEPSPILMILPDKEMGHRFSTQRVSPMVRDSGMSDLFRNNNDGSNTITMKSFKGGSLRIGSAGVATDLTADSIRVLLLDEVDKYTSCTGKGGDPVELAKQRTKTYPDNKKIILTSTPLIKGDSKIESAYDNSDQRTFNHLCIHCDTLFAPTWDLVKWNIVDEEPIPDSALLYCPHCGGGHNDHERHKSVRNGEWITKYPERKVAGFYLNVLSSPWTKLAEEVVTYTKALSDSTQMQKFMNENLGLPYEVIGERFDNIEFNDRLEDYDKTHIPNEVLFLTAGVDTQADRLECVVYGWGKDYENWVIDHFIVHGPPNDKQTWYGLHETLQEPYIRNDELVLKVRKTGIDTGGNTKELDGFSEYVKRFCKDMARFGYMPFKGASHAQKSIFPMTKGKSLKVYLIDTDLAKSMLYGNLKKTKVGGGYIHFHRGLDEEFFTQLTSEQRVVEKNKNGLTKVKWKRIGSRRAEILDCSVYALAARLSLFNKVETLQESSNNRQVERLQEINKDKVEEEVKPEYEVQKPINNSMNEPSPIPPPKPRRMNPRFKQQYSF
jgi:phage terminase large subunit GpA-like protein